MMLRRLIFVICLCQVLPVKSGEVLLEEEEQLDIRDENGRIYLEFTDVIENLTLEIGDITSTAKDVRMLLDAVLEAVENGHRTVKAPKQIDPDESRIPIEDALRKIEDIIDMETMVAQNFLEKVENLISEMNNETRAYARLLDMKKTVQLVTEKYTQAMTEVTDQKRSFAINQLYEYLYIDEENRDISIQTGYQIHKIVENQPGHESDDDAKLFKLKERIPYGNDAHYEDDEITNESLTDEIPKIPVKKAGYSIHVPAFAYVSIALVIVAFSLIAVGVCVCTTRRRKQLGSSPPSLAEETKKEPISIVTIPVDFHNPVQPANTATNDLPSYLDVICDKM